MSGRRWMVGIAALFVACVDPKVEDPDCLSVLPEIEVSTEQVGAATVRWTTAEPGGSVVEWGGSELDRRTIDDGVARTEHAVMFAGPAPGAVIQWRVISATDAGECASAPRELEVAAAGDEVAGVELVSSEDGFTPGFRLLPLDGDPGVTTILDDAGAVVWSWPTPKDLTPSDAFLEPGGVYLDVLELSVNVEDGTGGVYRMPLDRSTVEFAPLPYVHHAFSPLADGRIAWLRADAREVDGYMVAGDDVMVSNADGTDAIVLLTTWYIWTPDVPTLLAGDNHYYPTWLDWTHLNSVQQREDGSLLVSSHKLSVVLNIELDGTLRWSLAGDATEIPSDFTYSGDADLLFERAHNPVEVDGGLLIFDNGSKEGEYSQAVEYTLDEDALTLTPSWDFHADGQWHVSRQGDVQRFDNGNTLVNWGSAGALTEVTTDGTMVWELSTGRLFAGFSDQYTSIGGVVE